jgi:hypothetical protein
MLSKIWQKIKLEGMRPVVRSRHRCIIKYALKKKDKVNALDRIDPAQDRSH